MTVALQQLVTPPTGSKSSIIQLLECYRRDARVDKLNLTIGIYLDETGQCPILESVRQAERHRTEHQGTKASFNIVGAPAFHQAVRTLLFPSIPTAVEDSHVRVIQTLGASGALFLAGQLIHQHFPAARIWMSAPTWENHAALLRVHEGQFGTYRYRPASQESLCLSTILADLEAAAPGDVVLFHVCCHNPTGIDPSLEQWDVLAKFCAERRLTPLFDFAYQGLADSIQRDAAPLSMFVGRLDTVLICSSFSKNLGIYDERTGALTLVCRDEQRLARWQEELKMMIRSSYSMPPLHGSYIASHIINDPERFARWQREVEGMREDLDRRRTALITEFASAGILNDVLSYRRQRGMFICLDLSAAEIGRLRTEYGVYMLDSGRISIASLDKGNMARFCDLLVRITHDRDYLLPRGGENSINCF